MGPSEWENHPTAIQEALEQGFEVEVDIWYWNDELWLGHDKPEYRLNEEHNGFKVDLRDSRIWCHAKNLKAFEVLHQNPDIHVFWHQDDDIVLTSKGFIWTYPGIKVLPGAILVMPEDQYRTDGIMPPLAINKFIEDMQYYLRELGPFVGSGICSDYVQVLRDELTS